MLESCIYQCLACGRGEVQAWGWNFGIPQKSQLTPLSPENMICQKYKDVKNIKNSLAHKVQCRLCQSNPHFNRQKQDKKKQPSCTYQLLLTLYTSSSI